MHYFYGTRTMVQDRDLSRAAAERHFLLQAVAERAASSRGSSTRLPRVSRRWLQRWSSSAGFTRRRAA